MNLEYYSGVGSRETPNDILNQMTMIANALQDTHILRSGGAPGADLAFENGVTNGNKEIYIPWKGFNKSDSLLYDIPTEATYIASQYHPTWKNLSQAAKKLMSRNVCQILGKDLKTKSKFVICWTQDGCQSHKTRTRQTGGTGMAISIASENDVPVCNMKSIVWKEILLSII